MSSTPENPKRDDSLEGPGAARRFEHTLSRVLRVSKIELTKREAEYQQTRHASKSRSSHKKQDR
jgi:hypothetical protein